MYSLWLSLKIEKVAITHLAMEIYLQTTDHVVAVEKVAEQHIGTKFSSCNTYEDIISHILMVIAKNSQSSYYSLSYGDTLPNY